MADIFLDTRTFRASAKKEHINSEYRLKVCISCSDEYTLLHTGAGDVANGHIYNVILIRRAIDADGDMYSIKYRVPVYKGYEPESFSDSTYITNVFADNFRGQAKMNIQNISLTETCIEKFNRWFDDVAKKGVYKKAAIMEALEVLEEKAGNTESLVYELGQQYTNTGRSELFIFTPDDVEIEWLPNDPDDK